MKKIFLHIILIGMMLLAEGCALRTSTFSTCIFPMCGGTSTSISAGYSSGYTYGGGRYRRPMYGGGNMPPLVVMPYLYLLEEDLLEEDIIVP